MLPEPALAVRAQSNSVLTVEMPDSTIPGSILAVWGAILALLPSLWVGCMQHAVSARRKDELSCFSMLALLPPPKFQVNLLGPGQLLLFFCGCLSVSLNLSPEPWQNHSRIQERLHRIADCWRIYALQVLALPSCSICQNLHLESRINYAKGGSRSCSTLSA